jgi:outer membrane protein OmpA-like peptidoglycan-associated protein
MQKTIIVVFCLAFISMVISVKADKPYIDTAVQQSAIGLGIGAALSATGIGIMPGVLVASLFGPVIGHNMQINESQYLQLVDKLNSYKVQIVQQGDEIKFILVAKSFFNRGSPNLVVKQKKAFPILVRLINNLPASIIRVAGFSDNIGSVERNSALAVARADAVVSELSRNNLSDTRLIMAVSGDELLPVTRSGNSEFTNIENVSNRVEITLNPIEHLRIG